MKKYVLMARAVWMPPNEALGPQLTSAAEYLWNAAGEHIHLRVSSSMPDPCHSPSPRADRVCVYNHSVSDQDGAVGQHAEARQGSELSGGQLVHGATALCSKYTTKSLDAVLTGRTILTISRGRTVVISKREDKLNLVM